MRNYSTIFKLRTQGFAGRTCLFMAATLYSTSNPERQCARASKRVRTRERERERERERSFIDEQECEREEDHQQLLLQGGRESTTVTKGGGGGPPPPSVTVVHARGDGATTVTVYNPLLFSSLHFTLRHRFTGPPPTEGTCAHGCPARGWRQHLAPGSPGVESACAVQPDQIVKH